MNVLKLCCVAFFFALVSGWARPASAHPMGNFSINHLTRFGTSGAELSLHYILDFAEIPTADRMAQLDFDGNGTVSAAEKSAYLKTQPIEFLKGLSLQLNGKKATLQPRNADLEVRAGAGGLPTLRVWMDARVPLPSGGPTRVEFEDENFAGRTGWMDVVTPPHSSRAFLDSDAAATDASHDLTRFPIDAGVVPPRRSRATFSVAAPGIGPGIGEAGRKSAPGAAKQPNLEKPDALQTNTQTPQNRFTQSIAERNLTPGLVLAGLLAALLFGAVHALSPGHGKTMVAAYLVGSRGTPRHAMLLGLVVTVTHTIGVFALGMALLFASRYILPEKLFPALSALSGMLIFGVGLWLFMSRWQGLSARNPHGDHAHGDHAHGDHAHGDHSHDHEHGDHSHDHEHGDHSHDHEHGEHSHDHHSHDGAQVHSHGGRAHSHAVPDGPITLKTLVALGISGGIVPCPEALVVLLAAVKLHRIGYGMLLICAFSVGLAVALMSIGLLVVSARHHLSRWDKLGEGGVIVRYLPLGSAAIITLIGAVLTLRATVGGF